MKEKKLKFNSTVDFNIKSHDDINSISTVLEAMLMLDNYSDLKITLNYGRKEK